MKSHVLRRSLWRVIPAAHADVLHLGRGSSWRTITRVKRACGFQINKILKFLLLDDR